MRRAALCLMCLALAGCGKPDFDQRYAEKEKQLSSEAAAMQAELDKRMTEKPGMETPESGK
ncbi:hypothetical protein H0274_07240 [Altererythrobacter sp. CC-YST694]|uniref:hypothetical protein n=1 Tax=Altererythrobacter sp. CC-YST694 TaxID=2755038 RepID=UPI001D00F6B7|nr:hypothetical protein [Altererythrobacter sp. CC-YST694]MCB5425044.1 hypothetical protein [Altererythrobacter sp. CC-YST694]